MAYSILPARIAWIGCHEFRPAMPHVRLCDPHYSQVIWPGECFSQCIHHSWDAKDSLSYVSQHDSILAESRASHTLHIAEVTKRLEIAAQKSLQLSLDGRCLRIAVYAPRA